MNADMEKLTRALAGRYAIERELGAGGMATVYLAQDEKHDRKVAVKVLKPELAAVLGAERFVVEIKTTASLQHPHILPLFDSGTADGFLFYVMPYVQGETLRDKLNRETQFGVDEAVRIARDVADALDYAHRHGVIHRDIKPENILLHDGRPMVADFGIALAVSAAAGGRMTETGLSLGTPHYMSPEQATAEKEITARADIYSLGSVLYEMLTGNPPHTGASAQQIIMKIITESAAPVTQLRKSVPANVAAAVAQSLEKLPADRFESAKAFADALGNPAFARSGAGDATAGHLSRGTPTNRWVLGAVVAGTLAAGVLLGVLLSRRAPVVQPIVRFVLEATAGQSLVTVGNGDAPFALSPDGSRIAFVGRDSGDQRRRLYVRPLDRLVATVIPGTEEAINPFFSPDGIWIGFVHSSDRKIRKVASSGGPVSVLADDASLGRGAPTWGDDGFITFVPGSGSARVLRVSGSGGPVTTALDSGAVATVVAPWALPGGRSVLVSVCPAGTGGVADCRRSLMALDVVTKKLTPLVENAARGWYLAGGVLVYGTFEGAVFAVKFNAERMAVTDAPVALLDGIDRNRFGLAALSISSSGAMAYFPTRSSGNATVVQVDRTGREQALISKPGPYRIPRLSPDGTRIALTMPDAKLASQIWIHNRASGTTSQLTFEGESERASWSPDGLRLAFSGVRAGGMQYVWSVPADGSAPAERVGDGPEVSVGTATSWTRDGKWIVFDGPPADGKGAGGEDVFALPASGKGKMRPVVATPANEQTGEVSPDGRWIAYASDDAGRYQVYIAPFMAPGGRTLISTGPAQEAGWISNTELVYVNAETDSLVLARIEFGAVVRVTRTALFDVRPYTMGTPSWRAWDATRDGKSFVLVRPMARGTAAEPVIVLNWVSEVRRLMAATGAR